jgi:hypothetical protein
MVLESDGYGGRENRLGWQRATAMVVERIG